MLVAVAVTMIVATDTHSVARATVEHGASGDQIRVTCVGDSITASPCASNATMMCVTGCTFWNAPLNCHWPLHESHHG
jgi:hypothetical protein